MKRTVKSTAASFVALGLTLAGSGDDGGNGAVEASPTTMTEPAVTPSGPLGGYQPVSDVAQHAKVSADVCDINALLDASPIDFAAVGALARAYEALKIRASEVGTYRAS